MDPCLGVSLLHLNFLFFCSMPKFVEVEPHSFLMDPSFTLKQ